ncbi:MAG TPA: ribosome biogenesis GTP-binding protein YihA/YsxC [Bacteroidales bacterium]|nr:ribosome biogenesis GTP-binding protein YihA/YsxC [Bacteroidales bacterium]HRZ75943.1 ribosome biogenesis GTP-binding protein YihA/YsxC [Bacteroidales bacterium]
MEIKKADYVKSSARLDQCPEPLLPEYAFIGRSNVGKSTLINMITGKKGLAKTSGTPGKTQLISHFIINEEWYLVDLPGYGYARRSRSERGSWERMVRTYLTGRTSLVQVFLLLDARLEPQDSDLRFMEWMARNGIPFVLIFTKSDKLGRTRLQEQVTAYKEELMQTWDSLPPAIISSATTRQGREEILSLIGELNDEWTRP